MIPASPSQSIIRSARCPSRRAFLLTGAGAALVAACTPGQSQSNTPSQLSGKLIFKSYLPGEPAKQAHEAALEAWKTANPQVTIEPDFVDNAGNHTTSLRAQLAGGTPPDVAQVEYQWSIDFALDGVLLPLDSYMKKDRVNAEEWFQTGMEFARLNDKQYALPITGHAPLLYYNKDLFQRAGVPLPPAQHTWRWSDMLDAAQRLTRRGATPQESQWGILQQVILPYQVGSYVWQAGGTITDTRVNPTKVTLDGKALDGLQFLIDLRHKHQFSPSQADEATVAAPNNLFTRGQAAMWYATSVGVYTTLANTDIPWDIAFIPRGPDGKQTASCATNHMAALQSSKSPEAAWRFTQFMSSGEGARLRANIQSIPPASKKVFDEVYMKASPPVRRQVLRDTHAWTLDLFKGRGIGDTHNAVNTALLKAWNGTAPLNAAVQEAIQQGTQVLQTQKR